MKAVVRHRFGSPDVLRFAETPRPAVARGQILVAVHAAAVNRGDALEVRGWPYLARVTSYGWRRPRRPVPGTDVAGVVVAVGRDVTGFDVDDEVVGWASGAWAELAVIDADRAVRRPVGLAAIDAAAVPTTGVVALQALRAARVGAGSDVAVIGASGGVGTFAVQIARSTGAVVTGVAGTGNVDLVRSLGAARVVDHRTEDVTADVGRYDAVIDLVGDRPIADVRRILRRDGTLVVVGGHAPQSLTDVPFRGRGGAIAVHESASGSTVRDAGSERSRTRAGPRPIRRGARGRRRNSRPDRRRRRRPTRRDGAHGGQDGAHGMSLDRTAGVRGLLAGRSGRRNPPGTPAAGYGTS